MRLEKEKVPFEQRIKSLAPLLTSQLEKIASRKVSYKPKNYHKAEKSFAKRYQTIKFLLIGVGSFRGKESPSESEIKNYLKKLLRSCKNFSADEIKVLKEKGKA